MYNTLTIKYQYIFMNFLHMFHDNVSMITISNSLNNRNKKSSYKPFITKYQVFHEPFLQALKPLYIYDS